MRRFHLRDPARPAGAPTDQTCSVSSSACQSAAPIQPRTRLSFPPCRWSVVRPWSCPFPIYSFRGGVEISKTSDFKKFHILNFLQKYTLPATDINRQPLTSSLLAARYGCVVDRVLGVLKLNMQIKVQTPTTFFWRTIRQQRWWKVGSPYFFSNFYSYFIII
jgi:hypothetical protein